MKSLCRFSLLSIAVWAANVAIAGNLDVEIHCVPKQVDETVKKVLDGGANETKEHSHTAPCLNVAAAIKGIKACRTPYLREMYNRLSGLQQSCPS